MSVLKTVFAALTAGPSAITGEMPATMSAGDGRNSFDLIVQTFPGSFL
jgi:hypothetical protein